MIQTGKPTSEYSLWERFKYYIQFRGEAPLAWIIKKIIRGDEV